MDLRIFTLLIVSYNVAYAHNSHDGSMSPTMPRAISIPRDCEELYSSGKISDGVYTIYVDGAPMEVYCDMTNGGWIVLQKRTDGSVDYNRTFEDYEKGFGDVNAEHWLGLEKMHVLTASPANRWVVRFDLPHDDGETYWARYGDFRISDAGDDYTMTFDEKTHIGTLKDNCYPLGSDQCTHAGLIYHNGMKFSARDYDQDLDPNRNCAEYEGGGWWYRSCRTVLTTATPFGIVWYNHPSAYSFGSAIIKIKKSLLCQPHDL